MMVVQGSKEVESIALSIPRIEEDDLVSAGTVVFLVAVQEVACAQIRVDVANTIQKDIWPDKTIVNLIDMLHDFRVDILHELIAVGQVMENFRNLLRHLLILVQSISQQGRILAKGLPLHKTAKLLKDIKREDIDIIARTLDAFLDGGDLLPH